MIRRYKKSTVQLTSLLDLLFCMIFVSLLQTKSPVSSEVPVPAEAKKTRKAKSKSVPPETKINVNAVFHFYSTSRNPEVPTGTYAMAGTYDKTDRRLVLGGASWINRPEGFDMVPLKGKISSDGKSFVGRIEFQGCEQFTLRRSSRIGHSPIGGKWEGIYTCLQGETGLTLTLQ